MTTLSTTTYRLLRDVVIRDTDDNDVASLSITHTHGIYRVHTRYDTHMIITEYDNIDDANGDVNDFIDDMNDVDDVIDNVIVYENVQRQQEQRQQRQH